MREKHDVADSLKTMLVEREAFENAVRKLLQTPPTSKAEISRKIKSVRYRPLKPGPKR